MGSPGVYVVPATASLTRYIPPAFIERFALDLTVGQEVVREELLTRLDQAGFRRTTLVEEVGHYAIRGSIIDLFPSTCPDPIRIEFFDNEIESIRFFSTESQRSLDATHTAHILPVRDQLNLPALSASREELTTWLNAVKDRGRQLEVPPRELATLTNALKHGQDLPGIELAQACALAPYVSIFDYIHGKDVLLVIDEELEFWQSCDSLAEIIEERAGRFTKDQLFFPAPENLYISPDHLREMILSNQHSLLDSLEILDSPLGENLAVERIQSNTNAVLLSGLAEGYSMKQFYLRLVKTVQDLLNQEFRVAFVIGSQNRCERLHRILKEHELDVPVELDTTWENWQKSSRRARVAILQGQLYTGAQIPEEKIAFICESEIFGQRTYQKRRKTTTNLKQVLSGLSQLQEGDHVVHQDYGVGLYKGITHKQIDGHANDLVMIEYEDSTLYLPVQNIGKIQRFVGAEGQGPSLDRLSSGRWQKTKKKVRKSLETLAGDLIKLYAARAVAKGWRFDSIGAEDERFSDSFPYDETADQLSAIEACLTDMASERPMDRLVCGDVGFGKTEVALRASYKCLQHQRQVAVLAPTTILAEQHRQTFASRMKEFDITVGAVSSFYSSKRNTETIEKVARGEIDVIVGTHRLLSKDIRFADLGLLIIDEEHRFGVKQKERLKQLKRNVDVLTLTATPIPRTLHMSLLNVRDISLITTPPRDRRAIRTYTAAINPNLVRDSILREIQRGGQCFYLFNRVQNIEQTTDQLRELVPEARFEFAHGQMSKSQLERIMHRFLKHEIDVLVSTTIIESGIDIPSANTMLIERADRLGLAQLYQLRGRVGRSSEQAYCYFLVPREKRLNPDAMERLRALQSIDELGQGFHLAVRDLEIRGAGNLLGKEQSGSVLAVGFEMYTRILKEAIHHLKEDDLSVSEILEPEVTYEIGAYIPEVYIPDLSERLLLYQRLSSLQNDQESEELAEEIADRFGPYPTEVAQLIDIMTFRAALKTFGVLKADISTARISLSFSPNAPVDAQKIIGFVAQNPEVYRFSSSHALTIQGPHKIETPKKIYEKIRSLLELIKASDD
jgi:transcription-repair coupling factor (superfamily II helicase)